MTRLFVENGQTVDQILLDVLVEEKAVSESAMSIYRSKEMILENRSTNKTVFYQNRPIDRDIFQAVYSNIQNYQTHMDVAQALGFTPMDFGADESKRKQNLSKFIQRTVKSFNEKALPEDDEFPSFDKRQSFYIAKERKNAGWEPDEPTIADIDSGEKMRKDRVTKALDRINSQELISGEFYSNFTRIPKTRWGSWLRFWDREKTSVQNDKTLFGRKWGKTFIIGYQIEQNVLYEVWYNSIDSTFVVHDINGVEMSSRVRTMNEALRNMIRQVAQQSAEDRQIFAGSNPESRLIARSILQSVSTNIDPRVKELQTIDDKLAKKAKEDKLEARREEEKKRAEAQNRLKTIISNAFPKKSKDFDTNIDIGSAVKDAKKSEEDINKQSNDRMRAYNDAARSAKSAAEQNDKFQQWKTKFEDDIPSMGGNKNQNALQKRIADLKKKAKDQGDFTIEESFVMMGDEFDDFGDEIEKMTTSKKYDREIENIRKTAENSPYTQTMLKATIMGQVETYEDTRIQKHFSPSVFSMNLFRGRSAKIELPTDKPSLFSRIKMALYGQRFRADFVIGFTVANKVDIEVWYITEANPNYGKSDPRKSIASYYVFDVTAGKVLRKYLPYYRNTLPIVMAKIGVL